MKDEDPVVGGQAKIAFDPGTDFQRSSKGEQAVLGKSRAIVQAPVGEPLRTGVEGVRL